MMNQTTFIICIALLLVSFLAVRSCVSIQKEKTELEGMMQRAQNDSMSFYKDSYAREHAERLSMDEDMQNLNNQQRQLLDSIEHTLKVAKTSIDNAAAVSVKTAQTVAVKIDTVIAEGNKMLHFAYRDKWIDMNGLLSDTPVVHYSMNDSLVITTYRKKTGLFKYATYVNAWSLNPNSHIMGLTDYRLPPEKPRRFSVGPYIGYGYSGIRWQPSLGISVQYSLIRF